MAIEVGQEAPDFTLRDEDRNEVKLSDFRGSPVVLVFYPYSFSPPCSQELCEIRDDYSSWEEKGAKVFTISRDSFFVQKAWKEQEGFKHTLLSDMDGSAARAYDTWNDKAHVAERRTVVIDRDGKIAYTTKSGALGEVRDHSEVEAHLS